MECQGPLESGLFLWTATRGQILTLDNSHKCQICIVEWCCMCNMNGESMDHLLLHCAYVHNPWSLVFCMFGVQWVMPWKVVDLLACWKGDFGGHRTTGMWEAIPACSMWIIWQERNI